MQQVVSAGQMPGNTIGITFAAPSQAVRRAAIPHAPSAPAQPTTCLRALRPGGIIFTRESSNP